MDGYFLAGNKTVYTRPTAMGGGKIYGRFILQPCRKEVDPVFNLRRRLNKIVETMVDPTQRTVFERFSWNLWTRLSRSFLTCFILRMSGMDMYTIALSRSSSGSLSVSCGVAAGEVDLLFIPNKVPLLESIMSLQSLRTRVHITWRVLTITCLFIVWDGCRGIRRYSSAGLQG